ncbi:LLM class flavin-dependent oxidoreductase [Streptomyces longispororuber]|uniref:LLM class flavin-dependent oxidoreductase n=1 Tax=Streptomyces longispororuber TaxID=68230 RepID=UPI00210D0F6D|nr:LLM class flavin-dependent oxidoreductase [Streptomyces longispororuber]MCQ4208095.1 LLM class flavin-dependent oxidoreductase [Streptomyces longispororuber]
MTSQPGRGLLHLAAAVDLAGTLDAEPYLRLVRLAEHGALDFVTLHDTFAAAGPDSLSVLSRIAPATSRIGLVPTVTTTHTEPFHVQAAVATLDWVSRGRAGWRPDVSPGDDEAALVGRRQPPAPADLWHEAGEVADVARKLWDSWEDGAEIRDVATGRFVDRDKLHHVDFEGRTFSVRGPSIVPRPPQGNPVVVVDATRPYAYDVAARHADVALVGIADPGQLATARAGLRRRAAEHGRDPDELRVLAALRIDLGGGERTARPGHGGGPLPTEEGPLYRGGPVDLADLITDWHRRGAADGFHLTPLDPRRDLERLVNGTVPLLQHRALFRTFYPGSTLREHLDLARPANQFAALAQESS